MMAVEVKLCVAAEKGDDCGEGNARQVNHGLQASDRLCQVRFNRTYLWLMSCYPLVLY